MSQEYEFDVALSFAGEDRGSLKRLQAFSKTAASPYSMTDIGK